MATSFTNRFTHSPVSLVFDARRFLLDFGVIARLHRRRRRYGAASYRVRELSGDPAIASRR